MNGTVIAINNNKPEIIWTNPTIPAWGSSATLGASTFNIASDKDKYVLFAIVYMADTATSTGARKGLRTAFCYANTFDLNATQYGTRLDFSQGQNPKGWRVVYLEPIISNGVRTGLQFRVENGTYQSSANSRVCLPIYVIGLM